MPAGLIFYMWCSLMLHEMEWVLNPPTHPPTRDFRVKFLLFQTQVFGGYNFVAKICGLIFLSHKFCCSILTTQIVQFHHNFRLESGFVFTIKPLLYKHSCPFNPGSAYPCPSIHSPPTVKSDTNKIGYGPPKILNLFCFIMI